MFNEIFALDDAQLDMVSGGSIMTEMAAAGVRGAATGVLPPPSFPIGPSTGKGGGGKCPPNHNGVRY